MKTSMDGPHSHDTTLQIQYHQDKINFHTQQIHHHLCQAEHHFLQTKHRLHHAGKPSTPNQSVRLDQAISGPAAVESRHHVIQSRQHLREVKHHQTEAQCHRDALRCLNDLRSRAGVSGVDYRGIVLPERFNLFNGFTGARERPQSRYSANFQEPTFGGFRGMTTDGNTEYPLPLFYSSDLLPTHADSEANTRDDFDKYGKNWDVYRYPYQAGSGTYSSSKRPVFNSTINYENHTLGPLHNNSSNFDEASSHRDLEATMNLDEMEMLRECFDKDISDYLQYMNGNGESDYGATSTEAIGNSSRENKSDDSRRSKECSNKAAAFNVVFEALDKEFQAVRKARRKDLFLRKYYNLSGSKNDGTDSVSHSNDKTSYYIPEARLNFRSFVKSLGN